MSPVARPLSAPEGREPAHPWLKRYPPGVDWNAALTPQAVYDLLATAVHNYPTRPCTDGLGKALTYQEIGQRAAQAAAGLKALGVRKGTSVGLLLPSSPTYLIYYYGIL